MAKSAHPIGATDPVTAAHPMITGAAPQTPPQNVLAGVRRLSHSV